MNYRIYTIPRFSVICLMLLAVCIFAACDKDDDKGNNSVILNSYGPSPALRGGELRFIGTNLDKVTSVIIPGSAEITDITVVNNREIKVTIPQDAEVGQVILKTPQGELKTETILTYEEPIEVTGITTALIKAGEMFTIEGDYLNLVKEVIFHDNAVVTQFTSTRKKIEVIVPVEAQPGKIRVSNGAEIPIEVYSDDNAKIVEPAIESVPEIIKPGTTIRIDGSNLDLTASIIFGGGKEVAVIEDNINDEATQITVAVPEDAQDGKVILVAKSGLEYALDTEVITIVPSDVVATPAENLKAGDIITLKGVNMDLVVDITFPGMEEAVELQSKTTTEIKIAVPEAAQSGEMLLNLASGKNVPVDIVTLKPAYSGYNPSPANAGSDLTIQGTDMNLAATVTFGGEKTAEVSSATNTGLVVKVPVDAETGIVVLTMKNGEMVELPSLTVDKPVFCFITVLPDTSTEEGEILSGTILKVEVENADKLTEVQVNGIATQYIVRGSELNILVPGNAKDDTEFKLVSSNGEVSYIIDIIPAGKVETVIFDEEIDLGSWSKSFSLKKIQFSDVGFKPGSILRLYLTVTGDWPQIQINDASWAEIIMPQGEEVLEITDVEFTQEMIDKMMTVEDGWSNAALVIQGSGAIVHKVSTIVEN